MTSLVVIASAIMMAAPDIVTAVEDAVAGTVRSAQTDGSVVRLAFDADASRAQVVLVVGLLSNFPPEAAQYYLGKSIVVRGRVRSFRGVPEVVVYDAADITVVSAPAAPALTQAQAPSEIERLREQVRSLQQRLEQLEQRRPESSQ